MTRLLAALGTAWALGALAPSRPTVSGWGDIALHALVGACLGLSAALPAAAARAVAGLSAALPLGAVPVTVTWAIFFSGGGLGWLWLGLAHSAPRLDPATPVDVTLVATELVGAAALISTPVVVTLLVAGPLAALYDRMSAAAFGGAQPMSSALQGLRGVLALSALVATLPFALEVVAGLWRVTLAEVPLVP
jgi:hypothetical protein